jgi:hypothetical protein
MKCLTHVKIMPVSSVCTNYVDLVFCRHMLFFTNLFPNLIVIEGRYVLVQLMVEDDQVFTPDAVGN